MNLLESALVARGVKFTATHLGLDTDDQKYGSKFPYDKWEVTIECNGKSYSDIYKMGLGHRTLAFGVKKEGMKYFTSTGNYAWTDIQACEKHMLLVPRRRYDAEGNLRKEDKGYPKAWEVVQSWLNDSMCDQSFENWCSEYGLSNDSIKARDIYLHCQRIRQGLRDVFGSKGVEELLEASQESW